MMQKGKTNIAFVCTGNTCRSPMAEVIFNKMAREKGLNVVAGSFGISAMTGMTVTKNAVLVCAEIGIDIKNKTAIASNDIDVDKYEKFYCMTKKQAEMLMHFHLIPKSQVEVLDIPDPYGGDVDVYRQCRDEIYSTIKEIIKEYEN